MILRGENDFGQVQKEVQIRKGPPFAKSVKIAAGKKLSKNQNRLRVILRRSILDRNAPRIPLSCLQWTER